jgi:Methyltransferase domain.
MHKGSHDAMTAIVTKYMDRSKPYAIFELGSMIIDDAALNYKSLLDAPLWQYTGADISPGKNVDLVLPDPYSWDICSENYDIVLSGQTFEHIPYFWLAWKEMVRITKRGGLLFVIAPSKGNEHRYPVDCWRFFKDGMIALGALENVEVLEATTNYKKDSKWGDTVAVFKKPTGGFYG